MEKFFTFLFRYLPWIFMIFMVDIFGQETWTLQEFFTWIALLMLNVTNEIKHVLKEVKNNK